MEDVPPSPAQVPPQLLHDPAFLRAARGRDFAALFSMARAHGVSYYRISEVSGLKSDRVSLIARGGARVTALDTIERVADALRIPGALLELAARPWEDNSPTPHPESTMETTP